MSHTKVTQVMPNHAELSEDNAMRTSSKLYGTQILRKGIRFFLCYRFPDGQDVDLSYTRDHGRTSLINPCAATGSQGITVTLLSALSHHRRRMVPAVAAFRLLWPSSSSLEVCA